MGLYLKVFGIGALITALLLVPCTYFISRLDRRFARKRQDYVALAPPALAEFLLTVIVTSELSQAFLEHMHDRFARDCEEVGSKRAALRYWSGALHTVMYMLLGRVIAQAVKWGAIILRRSVD
jgi:hypothetical protein